MILLLGINIIYSFSFYPNNNHKNSKNSKSPVISCNDIIACFFVVSDYYEFKSAKVQNYYASLFVPYFNFYSGQPSFVFDKTFKVCNFCVTNSV